MEIERIRRKTFESLPEYSCSIPTGTIVGKVWRCNQNAYHPDPEVRKTPDWVICEYVDDPDPKLVGINYRKPVIIEDS